MTASNRERKKKVEPEEERECVNLDCYHGSSFHTPACEAHGCECAEGVYA